MAFCTKCGRSNQQGARFCNSCGATMYGASARSVSAPKQTAPSARRADAATVLARPQVVVVQGGIKSSGLAAVLSFFWCGLGHIYTGRIGTGLALMLIHPAVLVFGFMLAFGGLAGLGGWRFLARTPVPAERGGDLDIRHDQRLPHSRAYQPAGCDALLSGQTENVRLTAVIWNWLNTNSLAIQAIALVVSVGVTVFLVYYTRKYVSLTQKLAETANAELLSREKARKVHRDELESFVRALLKTLESLEVYGSIGREPRGAAPVTISARAAKATSCYRRE